MSAVDDFLDALWARGAWVIVEGDRVGIDAPDGALTAADLARLAALEPAILALVAPPPPRCFACGRAQPAGWNPSATPCPTCHPPASRPRRSGRVPTADIDGVAPPDRIDADEALAEEARKFLALPAAVQDGYRRAVDDSDPRDPDVARDRTMLALAARMRRAKGAA